MRKVVKFGVPVGVLIVLALVFIGLTLTVWATPSHADFVEAKADAVTLRTKQAALESAYGNYATALQNNGDQTQVKADYTKALHEYQQAVTTVSTLKATKHDAAVRRAYQQFEIKNTKFLNFTEGYVADYPAQAKFQQLGCDSLNFDKIDVDNLVQNYRAFLKKCEPSLTQMVHSKNQALAIYGAAMKSYLEKRTGEYQALLTAINNNDSSKAAAAAKSLSKGPDASTSAKIQKAHDDAVPTAAIDNLVTVTQRRAAATAS